MAVLTDIADPFVRRALSKPRPTRLGRSLLLLTVRGRTSGRGYTFPVQYAREGATIWVFPGRPEEKRWWRNLRQPSSVRLRLLGEDVRATARAIQGADEPDQVARGLTAYLSRFPVAARSLGLPRGASPEAIRDKATGSVIVRIDVDRSADG